MQQAPVDAAKISRHLDAGEIVLLSALAYSPWGDTFNVRTEEIAARAAPALLASANLCYCRPQNLLGKI